MCVCEWTLWFHTHTRARALLRIAASCSLLFLFPDGSNRLRWFASCSSVDAAAPFLQEALVCIKKADALSHVAACPLFVALARLAQAEELKVVDESEQAARRYAHPLSRVPLQAVLPAACRLLLMFWCLCLCHSLVGLLPLSGLRWSLWTPSRAVQRCKRYDVHPLCDSGRYAAYVFIFLQAPVPSPPVQLGGFCSLANDRVCLRVFVETRLFHLRACAIITSPTATQARQRCSSFAELQSQRRRANESRRRELRGRDRLLLCERASRHPPAKEDSSKWLPLGKARRVVEDRVFDSMLQGRAAPTRAMRRKWQQAQQVGAHSSACGAPRTPVCLLWCSVAP